ncbi:MAG: CHAT domain-containing protein [Saprospiraceae bacterium]
MDVLFTAFANNRQDFLGSLSEEDDGVYRLLSSRAGSNFKIHRDSYATVGSLVEYLTLYRDDLRLFLFSGHAGRDRLFLEDQEGGATGIAHLLGQCPRLQLVFLNGCSTDGQVRLLLEKGIPAVISTSAPVNDRVACEFSQDFFRALSQYKTIEEAFDLAKGATLTRRDGYSIEKRGFELREHLSDSSLWGLDYREEKAAALDWKLPFSAPADTTDSFEPNDFLLSALFDGLSPFDEEIRNYWEQEQNGAEVKMARKRIAILNALPAPLSQHLVKLLAPSLEEKDEGFNKPSEVRLRQMARVFNVVMELTTYTLLSQLWECFKGHDWLKCTAAQLDRIRDFFIIEKKERETCDLLPLIRAIREIFDENEVGYFIGELATLRQLIYEDPEFEHSYFFLQNLRVRTQERNIELPEVNSLCLEGEKCLSYLMVKTGFLAKYNLTSVQGIDVVKFRHIEKARFNHKTVLLRDVLGDLEESRLDLESPLDNYSVLLVNRENYQFLSLSPFIIDENAFLERADISKLYFFNHFNPQSGSFCFQYAAKPDDPVLDLSSSRVFGVIREQFDAFRQLLETRTEVVS